jgi:hypothetical protein
MSMNKQERYNELTVKELNDTISDEEMTEQVQLHYEIDPRAQKYFSEVAPGETPQDVWGMDTRRYR